jgi:transcriptional regulator with XRE-family HTH domain
MINADKGNGGMRLRLRELRVEKLITQAELSQRTGLTEATISRIETGVTRPRISTVRKLAAGLGVRPEELVIRGEVGDPLGKAR